MTLSPVCLMGSRTVLCVMTSDSSFSHVAPNPTFFDCFLQDPNYWSGSALYWPDFLCDLFLKVYGVLSCSAKPAAVTWVGCAQSVSWQCVLVHRNHDRSRTQRAQVGCWKLHGDAPHQILEKTDFRGSYLQALEKNMSSSTVNQTHQKYSSGKDLSHPEIPQCISCLKQHRGDKLGYSPTSGQGCKIKE